MPLSCRQIKRLSSLIEYLQKRPGEELLNCKLLSRLQIVHPWINGSRPQLQIRIISNVLWGAFKIPMPRLQPRPIKSISEGRALDFWNPLKRVRKYNQDWKQLRLKGEAKGCNWWPCIKIVHLSSKQLSKDYLTAPLERCLSTVLPRNLGRTQWSNKGIFSHFICCWILNSLE